MYHASPCTAWLCFALLTSFPVVAQQSSDPKMKVEFKDGITFHRDSLFSCSIRFRMQERIGFTSISGEDLSARIVDARVRRARLRFDGYVLDKRLRYYLHLGFSKADLDLETGTIPQPIRDAIVYYQATPALQVALGQTKLPGNRQRVTSSGNQQFPDLSIANAAFNLDRDFGVFAFWTIPAGTQQVLLKGAITTGDGRGASPGTAGLAYTGRMDWLPLGAFTNKGDYSEGDLEMEPKPKVSFGAVYSLNDNAVRTGGQLGNDLYAPRTMNTFIMDAMLKYKGWMVTGEYFDRSCDDPITQNDQGSKRFVVVGQGANVQFSKYFRSKFEIASRYSLVSPSATIAPLSKRIEEVLLGSSRYLNGHKIKLQAYIGYRWTEGRAATDVAGTSWTGMFQIEFGI